MDLGDRILQAYTERINGELNNILPSSGSKLDDAMRYAFSVGGKRIRPIMVLATCEALGGNVDAALPVACAIEMLHTSSLIYDDLPCMDNDSVRRGKPANHVVYGEDVTLLAGLGLNAEAYSVVTATFKKGLLTSAQTVAVVDILSKASGLEGIVPGQALDLNNKDGSDLSEEELIRIHSLKTGAMIKASVMLGCVVANASDDLMTLCAEFAGSVGLAFQIRDDILDVTSTCEVLGKTPGKDKIGGKTTFVDVYGVEKAQELVIELTDKALEALSSVPNNDFLTYLTKRLCQREA